MLHMFISSGARARACGRERRVHLFAVAANWSGRQGGEAPTHSACTRAVRPVRLSLLAPLPCSAPAARVKPISAAERLISTALVLFPQLYCKRRGRVAHAAAGGAAAEGPAEPVSGGGGGPRDAGRGRGGENIGARPRSDQRRCDWCFSRRGAASEGWGRRRPAAGAEQRASAGQERGEGPAAGRSGRAEGTTSGCYDDVVVERWVQWCGGCGGEPGKSGAAGRRKRRRSASCAQSSL